MPKETLVSSRQRSWIVQVGAVLLAMSAVTYLLHFLIFRDAHHIFIYLVGDIAFVPLEVLLVAIVIERQLHRHERREVQSARDRRLIDHPLGRKSVQRRQTR